MAGRIRKRQSGANVLSDASLIHIDGSKLMREGELPSEHAQSDGDKTGLELKRAANGVNGPDLDDPRVVLSLLESDQVVAAKRRSRVGRRQLSFGMRLLLWSLRVYVVIMLALALLSVLRAIHAVH
jgi:hypothetical protein